MILNIHKEKVILFLIHERIAIIKSPIFRHVVKIDFLPKL